MGSKTLKEAMKKILESDANSLNSKEDISKMSEADYLAMVCVSKLKSQATIRPSQLKDLQTIAGEGEQKSKQGSIDDLLKGVSNDRSNRT